MCGIVIRKKVGLERKDHKIIYTTTTPIYKKNKSKTYRATNKSTKTKSSKHLK